MSKYFKILRYIFAGGLATGTNLLILFICVHYFHLWYLTGAIISFCGGVIISYILQKYFTFKDYSKETIYKQFSIFFIFNIVMLSLNTFLIFLFVDIFEIWYMAGQALSSFLIAFINYNYFNRVIFKRE
ncbi:MAG: GtrA family protein [Candidatus Nomurabacteria bacterium]|nr:GtrA family protein [Candidatus Nomurabacteria bacterium]